MLRYIILFVLVMTMVKTNAQNSLLSSQSTDELLVRLTLTATQQDITSMLAKVANDPDFSTTSDGTGGYFILDKDPQSTITSQQAINNYLNESYVGSASFLYYDADGHFHGATYDVIVRGNSNLTATQISTAATSLGMLQMSDLIPELNMYLLYFDKTVDVFDVSDDLVQTGLFEYAHPNFLSEYTPHTYGDYTTSGSGDCFVMRQPATNDPFMVNFSQWGLYTGYTHEFNSIFLPPAPNSSHAKEFADINVCHAWDFANGSRKWPAPSREINGNSQLLGRPIYVAVVDDGVDTRHADLNIRRHINGVSAYGCDAVERTNPNPNTPRSNPIYNPSLPDDEGCPDVSGGNNTAQHGTSVAGVIAAKRNNGQNPNLPVNPPTNPYLGMIGVAYAAEIMPVRVAFKLNPNTLDLPVWDDASVIYGLKWARDEGADIINCSFGMDITSSNSYIILSSKSRQDAIDYAISYGRGGNPGQNQLGKGCVITWSSGNNNENNLSWPSSHSEVIAVGAMSMCHQRKSLVSCDGVQKGSNYGPGLPQYYNTALDPLNTANKLSVVAPGIQIVSTRQVNSHVTSGSLLFDGTSAAAPHVAGVAALILSVNPCLTYREVKDIIELSAEKIQPSTGGNPYQYATLEANGYYDPEVGYGKVNAGNAVTLAHDLYKQDMTETGSEVYHASHYIFAGAYVTNILPINNWINPDYIISPGADIKFYVRNGQGIVLTPGFRAEYGSDFLADPDVNISCDNSHHHYKPGKKDKNEINPSGKQPILSSSDNLLHGIKVYPNPAKETINIEFMLEGDADVSFTMLNMLGQKMKETETTVLAKGMQKQQMSLQGLTPGVYFVGIKTPAGYSQFRFIKE